jgi:hypothetical protein
MIRSLYLKFDINLLLGRGSCLGHYNKYGSYFAISHTQTVVPLSGDPAA